MSVRKVQSSDAATGGGGPRRFFSRPGSAGRPGRSGRPGRAWMVARLSVAIAAIALAATLLLPGPVPDRDGVTKAVARTRPLEPARPATVAISAQQGGVAVPRSFVGLSVEYWALPHFERHASLFDRVFSLIRAPGDGPVILRVGGDSADRTFWAPGALRVPRWEYQLTPSWWRDLRTVVRRTGVHVIVDLNLVTGSSSMAALWGRAAVAALPRGSIDGFEVGNEPDIYSNRYWTKAISTGRLRGDLVPRRLSAIGYLERFQAYASVLSQVAPNVPLIGPVVANPNRNLSWVATLLAGPHYGLGIVSVHRYPYSACVVRSSPAYATIARVLSENASAGVARAVAPAARLAHRAGLPFRLTELNSVTCGGRSGVSQTFATALWAPDTLFELLRAGVDGANIHVSENAINAAFNFGAGGLRARPLLYGLALFARTLGPGAQLVRVHDQAPASLHLKAWAVRVRGGILHVLLIDKGDDAVRVDLRVPGTRPANVQRLLAHSVTSRWGVRLDGQRIAGNGRWEGRRTTEVVARSGRGYEIIVPRFSAALVSVQMPGPATPRVRGGRTARVGGPTTRSKTVRAGVRTRRGRTRR